MIRHLFIYLLRFLIVEASKLRPRAVGSYRILQQRRIVYLSKFAENLKTQKKRNDDVEISTFKRV